MRDNGGCTSVPTGISNLPKAWKAFFFFKVCLCIYFILFYFRPDR